MRRENCQLYYSLTQRGEAHGLYNQAVELDSTFALAWMRLKQIGSEFSNLYCDIAIQNWLKYVHTMPQKWQDYHDAFKGDGTRIIEK